MHIFMAALPMFFLIAFRNQSIGADTGGYLRHFEGLIDTSWDELFVNTRMEPGYVVFVKLLTSITQTPLVFQVIYTSIYLIALVCFANELEDGHFLFLFFFGALGSYNFMFTGVRQCLAISICLLSYRFIKKRKILPFILFVLLAFQFHKSSILFIVAYFVYSRRLNWRTVGLYAIGTALAVLFLDEIQEWFNSQLDYDYGIEAQAGGIVSSLVMLVITIFTVFVIITNKAFTKQNQGLLNIGMVSSLLWIVRMFTRVAERPSYFFSPFLFAALACAMLSIERSDERKAMRLIIVVLSFALYVYKLLTGFATYIPYTFYTF